MTLWQLNLLVVVFTIIIAQTQQKYPQYHIQSEEGEIKFFKYSTHGGQYRKEIRLEDGSVVGTYGWEDDSGTIRLYDYVADNKGYRIVGLRKFRADKLREHASLSELAEAEEDREASSLSSAPVVDPNPLPSEFLQPPTAPPRLNDVIQLGLPLPITANAIDVGDSAFGGGRHLPFNGRHGRKLVRRKRRKKRLDEIEVDEPATSVFVIPFQETLLLENQYPSGGEGRPYLRVLTNDKLVTVPKVKAAELLSGGAAEGRSEQARSSESMFADSSRDQGERPTIELPSTVLLKKIKVTPDLVSVPEETEQNERKPSHAVRPDVSIGKVRVKARQRGTAKDTDGDENKVAEKPEPRSEFGRRRRVRVRARQNGRQPRPHNEAQPVSKDRRHRQRGRKTDKPVTEADDLAFEALNDGANPKKNKEPKFISVYFPAV